MAGSVKTWLNNNPPQCEDADLNGFKNENNNLIVGSGQILDDANHQQTHKAVSHYAAGGDFYTDSGAANAYVLSAGGSRTAPPGYFTGMRVRFVAGVANTGASTVNVASLGVKNIKTAAGGDPSPGQIANLVELSYDGTDFLLRESIASPLLKPVWAQASAIITASESDITVANITPLSANRFVIVGAGTLDGLRAYDYTGTSMVAVGADLTVPGFGGASSAIAGLTSTDFAYIDVGNADLRTYRFNGATFAQVGADLNISGPPSSVSLAALNSTDVAYVDGINDELRVYRSTAGTFAQVGSGLAISGLGPIVRIAALNSTDVALIDNGNNEVRLYRWNGAAFSLVGSGLAMSPSSKRITALNDTDVATLADDDTMHVYRFNFGLETWEKLPPITLVPTGAGSSAGICAINGTDVILKATFTNDFIAYRFGFAIGAPPHSRTVTG